MGLFDPGMQIFSSMIRGSPTMPAWTPIDPLKEQTKTIAGNQAALPAAEKLASGVNQFNEQQINDMLAQAGVDMPGISSQANANIESMLKGEIPSDVSSAVTRSSAAKALGGGFGGSGMAGDLTARDLGLTSLSLTSQGLSSAESWMKSVDSLYAPGMMNATSMFLSPAQVMAQDTSERDKQFQYDWGKNLLKWQTSTNYAIANEMDTDSAQFNQIAGSMLGSFAGGAMGGA